MSNVSLCPNCHHPEPGAYCAQCGQKQADPRLPLRRMFAEFIDEEFGVNRRLPRTLKLLLFSPGTLTNEYFSGRIQQYIPPLRLYLLSSLVFFGVFLSSQNSAISIGVESGAVESALADTTVQRTVARKSSGKFIGVRVPDQTDNWVRDAEVNFIIPSLTEAAQQNLRALSALGQEEATRRIARTAIAQIPTVFFVLLPVYALLLFLFFRRQRRFYVEHFIFALHLHAFVFLALLPTAILDLPFLPGAAATIGNIISAPLLLGVLAYVGIALKRVYNQGWLAIAGKYWVLFGVYMVFFLAGLAVASALALATM